MAFPQIKWAPIGAKWYVSKLESIMPPNEGYILYESIRDTLIQEKNVKVISKTYFHSNGKDVTDLENEYSYEKDSVIYYWKNGNFYTLYDFKARPGDKWTVYGSGIFRDFCGYDSLGVVVVDSVANITINNQKLRAIYTSSDNYSNWSFEGVILELVGNITHMLPKAKECVLDVPDEEGVLRCYEDNIIGVYKSGYCWSIDCKCNELRNYTSVNNVMNSSFRVYPNPVKDYLNIQCLNNYSYNGFISAEIYNMNGKKAGSFRNLESIFVGYLDRGFYLLKLLFLDQTLYFKIIKE